MKNLEAIYSSLLGEPKKGDLQDLEAKYRQKTGEIDLSHEELKVDISLIQHHGELQNAYLYLKTKWSINERRNLGLITSEDNTDTKSQALNTTSGDFLSRIYSRLKSMSRVGFVLVAFLVIYQLGYYLLIDKKVLAFTSKSALEEAVSEIRSQQSKRKSYKPALDSSKFQEIKNETEIDNSPGLILAAKNCSILEMNKIIEAGSNINMLGKNQETVVHWLSRRNCPKALTWAINKGADVNIRDSSGRTPLDWAKASNSYESIQVFNKLTRPN